MGESLRVRENSTEGPPEPFHSTGCQTAASPKGIPRKGEVSSERGRHQALWGRTAMCGGWVKAGWHSPRAGPSVDPNAQVSCGLGSVSGVGQASPEGLHGPALPLLPNCEQQQCSAGQKHPLLILLTENALDP